MDNCRLYVTMRPMSQRLRSTSSYHLQGETGAAWERRVSASHDSAGADIAAPPRKTLDLAARHSPSDGWADVDGRDQSSQRNERNE